MEKTFQVLEFDKILKKLEEYSYTEYAKEKFRNLRPYLSDSKVVSALNETTEARKVLDYIGNPPLISMKDMQRLLITANKGRNAYCNRVRIYWKHIKSSKEFKKLPRTLQRYGGRNCILCR